MVLITDISEQSSATLSTYDYDVFLSFRGEDTRNNFTDHLLKALEEATIKMFFDDSWIQIGDSLKPELENAIKSSRASIIVLSKNYASSTWCLDELAQIMEQQRTSNHIVFPIFYHVKPSDVRKQQNSFKYAIAQHKARLEAESNAEKRIQLAQKMKQWEKALTQVADLKGEEANGRCYPLLAIGTGSRRETVLIEGIVKNIISKLHLANRSKIPHIIGNEYSIREITAFLKDGSDQSTEFLTVWGMAGIGKTYLVDYVFQLHSHDFERNCFLEDIERRCTQPNGFLDLQKQLLKDIRVRSWMDIDNVNAGTLKIEKALSRKRTLLVLDGINKFEQLDVLIGTKGLHPGSKIIITTKNGSLTEKCRLLETQVPPMHTKHLLEGLENDESLQLLSWYAFGRNEPNEDEKKQLMKVVKYCKGHPLALKILGSSFRSEDATWGDILKSLGKEINPDIEKVLKVGFDTLPSEKDKELFKYIACLFDGKDRKSTEEILKACGICKSSGIKVLINRCLLSVRSSDNLIMHQLLQDMGRDIVRQESPKKPWKRSILWHHQECLDVLQNRQGTSITQGLALNMRTFENKKSKESSNVVMQKFGFKSFPSFSWVQILLSIMCWLFGCVSEMRSSSGETKGDFNTLALSEMSNLRILQLNYVQLSGSYKNFPQGLRWLSMHGFPLRYIPLDLQMDNMVALDISNSKLRRLWRKPKLLKSLKFLNLSSCHELVSLGNFSWFPVLEKLCLASCTSLEIVCESIGSYSQKLEVLDLRNCIKLKELPRSIGMLKNLTQLLIDGCTNLGDFPGEMKDMHSLEVLHANNAISRSFKSFVISLPRSLVQLSLRKNNLSNESFPKDFSSLTMLKVLYLDDNPIVTMPDCVRNLRSLETLSFGDCLNLKTVLCAPDNLKYLCIYKCNSLEKVTFHPEKSAPPEVYYLNASTVIEIQDKFKMQDLAEIDEDVLRSLGWTNIDYYNYHRFSMANHEGLYHYAGTFPRQMLFEHGIFSTYLAGQEVPKWFTHRSNGSLFTLEPAPGKGKIQGINVCIVRTISSMMDVGPLRIEITNLTKNSSWTYHPIIFAEPEDYMFEFGDEDLVWLSHWMFRKNEFENGDEVIIHYSVKFFHLEGFSGHGICYGGEGPDYANVKEYGISLVYDDGSKREDPLAYYKSWKHLIGEDLSAAEETSGRYLLKPWPY